MTVGIHAAARRCRRLHLCRRLFFAARVLLVLTVRIAWVQVQNPEQLLRPAAAHRLAFRGGCGADGAVHSNPLAPVLAVEQTRGQIRHG